MPHLIRNLARKFLIHWLLSHRCLSDLISYDLGLTGYDEKGLFRTLRCGLFPPCSLTPPSIPSGYQVVCRLTWRYWLLFGTITLQASSLKGEPLLLVLLGVS